MGAAPRLLLIPPFGFDPDRLAALLPDLAGVADALLLRQDPAGVRPQLDLALRLLAVTDRPRILVGGRADVAQAGGADGLQLRDEGLDPARVRAAFPALPSVGISRHRATLQPEPAADWVVFAPVHEPLSKPGSEGVGLEGLRRAVEVCGTPVLALGGMTPERVADARRAGAHGVATCGEVFGAADPGGRARAFRAALDGVSG